MSEINKMFEIISSKGFDDFSIHFGIKDSFVVFIADRGNYHVKYILDINDLTNIEIIEDVINRMDNDLRKKEVKTT